MALLADLRGILRRRDAGPADSGAPRSLAGVEPKPAPPSEIGRIAEQQARRHEALMERLDALAGRIEADAAHRERAATLLERAPAALEALPDIGRQNARIIELLQRAGAASDRRDATVQQAVERLGDSARQQSEVLGLLQQQLDENQQAVLRTNETLEALRQALLAVGHDSTRSVETLGDIARAAESRDARLETMLARMERWVLAVLVCCAAAVIVGGVALVVAIL